MRKSGFDSLQMEDNNVAVDILGIEVNQGHLCQTLGQYLCIAVVLYQTFAHLLKGNLTCRDS